MSRFTLVAIIAVVALLVSTAATATLTPITSFDPKPFHKYCVIGGGTGGLQAGYLLHRYGMDYVVLERNSIPGSFFDYYPRQRKLISINKVYTGTNDTEFNLRHDWNSLLNGDDDYFFPTNEGEEKKEPYLFKEVSKDYYPDAGTIPIYLKGFLERNPLNVVFDAEVASVHRDKPQPGMEKKPNHGRFHVSVFKKKGDTTGWPRRIECQVVILATGKTLERNFTLAEGTHLITRYTDAPQDPAAYTNQDVLILGAGNSAFELAKSLESYTALLHIASRNPIQMAFNSHYVGDVRSINLGFLDRYQLKSMDVLLTLTSPDIKHGRLYFNETTQRIMLRMPSPTRDAKRAVATKSTPEEVTMDGEKYEGEDASKAADDAAADAQLQQDKMLEEAASEIFPSRKGYHRVISCLGFQWNPAPFKKALSSTLCAGGASSECGQTDSTKEAVAVDAAGKNLEQVSLVTSACNGFPEIASNFESVNNPDFFTAGALAHYRDFKRSAGGFIHGFRYTARTLIAMLRERYEENARYPFFEYRTKEEVLRRIMHRMKNVSSLYQMQSQLADVILINDDKEKTGSDAPYLYFQDLPIDNVKSRTPSLVSIAAFKKLNLHFVTLTLEFGKDFQGVATLYHQAQKETYKRRAEKMQWDTMNPQADPDYRLSINRADPTTPLPKMEKVTAAELMRRDEEKNFKKGDGNTGVNTGVFANQATMGHMPAAPAKTTLLQPLEPPPTMLPPKDGKPPRLDRFLFLHPVAREWVRSPAQPGEKDAKDIEYAKHQLVREVRLHEDVLNDFTGRHYHETPMRNFLEKALP